MTVHCVVKVTEMMNELVLKCLIVAEYREFYCCVKLRYLHEDPNNVLKTLVKDMCIRAPLKFSTIYPLILHCSKQETLEYCLPWIVEND
jgi:hypothetical protein